MCSLYLFILLFCLYFCSARSDCLHLSEIFLQVFCWGACCLKQCQIRILKSDKQNCRKISDVNLVKAYAPGMKSLRNVKEKWENSQVSGVKPQHCFSEYLFLTMQPTCFQNTIRFPNETLFGTLKGKKWFKFDYFYPIFPAQQIHEACISWNSSCICCQWSVTIALPPEGLLIQAV